MDGGSFTPFFVADRQASLRILQGLEIQRGRRIGIMTHAKTHSPFKDDISRFPCFDLNNCGLVNGPCPYDGEIALCDRGRRLKESCIKMSDSGVFQKEGCDAGYPELFDDYDEMGVEYGVIIDRLKDKQATLESAKEGMKEYRRRNHNFRLVGVCQGNTADEYLDCYDELRNYGYRHIAVGGMLNRRENSVRYVNVRDESLLREVLHRVREKYPNDWLFALGCYHPKRHSIFLEHRLFGSDYKGWIFQYNTKSPKRGNKPAQKKRFREVRSFIEGQVLCRSQRHRSGPRLLIIPCSKAKLNDDGWMPAIRRYNGPLYSLVRKYVSDFSNDNGLDILILSAKYGLIHPRKQIKDYDQVMTRERAQQLEDSCLKILQSKVEEKEYAEIMVNLGSEYLTAIEKGLCSISGPEIVMAEGRMGERLRQVKNWILS